MHRHLKKLGPAALLLAVGLLAFFSFSLKELRADGLKSAPKYVFLFIGDGMSYSQIMAYGAYFGTVNDEPAGRAAGSGQGPPLEMPSFVHFPVSGAMISSNASSYITDSASAATAMACGVKTFDGALGLDAAGQTHDSLAVLFKKKGAKVGLISSMSLNHATPAGFYAHRSSREDYYNIGLDLIASDFDFFGGGGLHQAKGPDRDQADLYKLARKAGYRLVKTVPALEGLEPGQGKVMAVSPVLGYLASMSFAIDVQERGEPRLKDFVRKGIELLDNEAGFFLMVEGGKIDLAAHANDACTAILDLKDFDESLQEALAFAEQNAKTSGRFSLNAYDILIEKRSKDRAG